VLGGAIVYTDLQASFLPQLADELEARAGESCTSSGCVVNDACRAGAATGDTSACDPIAASYLGAFDRAETSCASNLCVRDGHITHEEVALHVFVSTLLSPDVDLLDASGNYDPTPITSPSANPDSTSMGVGFTCKAALF
jgi:hypothetical protein